MTFREVKEFCKHAGCDCCPSTFKSCSKDFCPLVRDSDDCAEHCGLACTLQNKVEELKDDYHRVCRQFKNLKNDLKGTVEEYAKTIQDAATDLKSALMADLDRDLDL